VLKALGFEPENLPEAWSASDLKVTRWGTVKADVRNQMTNLDGGRLGDQGRPRRRRRHPSLPAGQGRRARADRGGIRERT
jgi:NADPH-dependent glutamate synthase beta subunit-like oxidoreductase